MAKKYKINIEYYEKLLDMLKAYSDGSEIIETDIRNLSFYLKCLKDSFNKISEQPILDSISDDFEDIKEYEQFFPTIESYLAKSIFDTYEVTPKYKKVSLSDDDAVSLAEEFFSKQGKYFYKPFLEFKENIHTHLEFIKPNYNTGGEAFFLRSIPEEFVYIPNTKDFTKATVLIHELQHVIDFYHNQYFCEDIILKEVLALFMEMIGCDFVASNLNLKKDNFLRRYEILSIVKCEGLDLTARLSILKDLKDLGINSQKKLDIYLENNEIPKEEFESLERESILSSLLYQIAFLIAIELYYIYLDNPKDALTICKKIVSDATMHNYTSILDKYGIVVGENFNRYEEALSLKLKK